MTREELLSAARRVLWAGWMESPEEIGSQAVLSLDGVGMLVEPGGAAELERLRALELGDPDGRVSATCGNPEHPTWLRARDDERGCPWCRVAELEAGQTTDGTYPPALPWARLMDHEDLTDFLDDLGAAAIANAAAEESLAEVEATCGRWRLIAEAQHAHNTAPGPDGFTRLFAPVQALREPDTTTPTGDPR